MSTQHTPGPWSVIDGHYPSLKEISGPSFKISVVMWATDLTEDDYRKRDADLHLIAAAPDLLDALQEVVKLANQAHDHWDNDRDAKVGKILLALSGHMPRYDTRIDAIHAAIAKATGETK